MEWPLFYNSQLKDAINKYSSFSTLGLDYVSWNHLKEVLNNAKYCSNIANIANACINLSYWPTHFKKSLSIILPKPNKPLYDILKAFCVMGRLNTNNFIFLFFYFSDFILIFFSLFFYVSFGWWRGTWYHSHMTGHMMWHHRPKTWWKDLEDDVRAHVYNIVALSREWGEHEVEAWTIGQA